MCSVQLIYSSPTLLYVFTFPVESAPCSTPNSPESPLTTSLSATELQWKLKNHTDTKPGTSKLPPFSRQKNISAERGDDDTDSDPSITSIPPAKDSLLLRELIDANLNNHSLAHVRSE